MKHYLNVETALVDAMRLAGGMTYKWAAAGIDGGGGKAVIAVPSGLDPQARKDLLRRFGGHIRQLNGLFLTGPDLGTTSEDMDLIAEKGDPYVFCRTPDAGGTGNPGTFTALGVYTSIKATAEKLFGEPGLAGKRILVQGVGSVGSELIKLLRDEEAEIFFSDVEEVRVKHFQDQSGLEFVPAEEVYDQPCDIFSPCAVGGILHEQTIPRLRCKAIAGGANNQLAKSEDAIRLEEKQILYAPDFISNSGGAIGAIGMETKGLPRKDANEEVVQLISENLSQVFDIAEKEGVTTDEAARRLAKKRLTEDK